LAWLRNGVLGLLTIFAGGATAGLAGAACKFGANNNNATNK
jgi:hypothetical protein